MLSEALHRVGTEVLTAFIWLGIAMILYGTFLLVVKLANRRR